MQSLKVFNDPIYGFISIPFQEAFDVIDHPYFQRLRRITQLGLTNMVYTGGNHTRFQHALGAMFLMVKAVDVIRKKGVEITEEEAKGVVLAILLHDIGHGPFSHTLEYSLAKGVHHEIFSTLFMEALNDEFEGKLSTAIEIFNGTHAKPFLHQLVSSQLDMDRLDYLRRDSFFTGVSEGVVGVQRIIEMLNVKDNKLVIEHKGIYSVEKFLVSRRIMYWQVYMHKTALAAEHQLIKTFERAKHLLLSGIEIGGSKNLTTFMRAQISEGELRENPAWLKLFAKLDDHDVLYSLKEWSNHKDSILSYLCNNLLNRKLFRIKIEKEPFDQEQLNEVRAKWKKKLDLDDEEISYLVFNGEVQNSAYSADYDSIEILHKDGSTVELGQDADLLNVSALTKKVRKYFMCEPKY